MSETRYDAVGNAIVRIDANGQVSRFLYDGGDALAEVREDPIPWTDPAI